MNRNIRKINFLTKLKMSLGIDTKADEINLQLNDLKKEKQKAIEKIEITSMDLSKIESIIVDIDRIYDIAKDDVLYGKAEDISTKVISYQLSIERAKKQNIDIYEIVKMQHIYQELLDKSIKEYINNIINKVEYSYGNFVELSVLLNNISFNLNRLKLNNTISSCDDLDKIKQYMLDKKMTLTGAKNNYLNQNSSLRKEIFAIENSEEKRMADYAVEVASNKKRK